MIGSVLGHEWRVEDQFRRAWRVYRIAAGDETSESAPDWQTRAWVCEIAYSAFDHRGAREDALASALLEIYDALTGADLSRRLPWPRRPTHDPRRLLRGIEGEIRRELLSALATRRIGIEPLLRAPWPFTGDEAPPSTEVVAPVSEVPTWIGLSLVDQTGRPVARRAYRVVFPDGTVQDGMLDGKGMAMLAGTVPGSCQVYCPCAAPHPELTYAVQQGDHISGIAQSFGFDDYTLVWDDPGNADLKNQRSDPHVLLPGDSLTIPELKGRPTSKPTGATHTFTIVQTPLKLRFKLLDLGANAIAGVSVTVAGTDLTADGSGLVEANVDKTDQTVHVNQGDAVFALAVAAINPNDDVTEAGYKARLYNLGFLWDPTADESDDEMVIALQDFQAEYQLPVTGQLDDATRAQLAQAHGC